MLQDNEMKKFTLTLTKKEWDRLSKAVDLAGMRTKAEFLRFLINDYVIEFYPDLKDKK